MKKHTIIKNRVLSLFLVFVMCLGMVDTAFAAEGEPDGVSPSQDVVTDTSEESATSTSEPTGTSEEPSTDTSEPATDATESPEASDDKDETTEHDTTHTKTETEIDPVTGEIKTTTTSGWNTVDESEPNKKTESSETKVEITITDKEGTTLEESGSVQGGSTTTSTTTETTVEPGTPDDEQEPSVDVEIGETTTTETPGEYETTETIEETTETQEVGDLPYAGDITVTLKPGDTDKKGTSSLTDRELADLLYGDPDYPLNEMLKEPKVETKENGDTITTTTTQADGQYVKTVVTQKADGTKVEEKTIVDLKGTPGDKPGQTNVTEFVVTTVTTTTNPSQTTEKVEEGGVTSNSNTVTSEPEFEDKVTITLPEKPEASESTAEDGTKTVVTVEEIKDNDGNVVGYQTTQTVTSADGKQVSSNSESVWGTKTTVSTTTQKDTTTTTDTSTNKVTTTTTTLITQGTTVSGHKITATEREVTASMGLVTAGADNGKVTMTPSVTPNVGEPTAGTTDTTTDLYHRADATMALGTATGKTDSNGNPIYNATITSQSGKTKGEQYQVKVAIKEDGTWIPAGNDFAWFGEYGLESSLMVSGIKNDNGTYKVSNGWQPHQFVVVDKNGQKFTVYCADFEISPKSGAEYNMTNIEDAPYYNADNAEHIRYIAENGYWGTTSGTGSLDALKTWLRSQNNTGLTEAQINALTPGQALTATQAAIWHFGNSGVNGDGTLKNQALWIGQDQNGEFAEITNAYNYGSDIKYGEVTANGSHSDDYDTVKALYQYLIQGKTTAPDETVFITENNFATSATITVGEKVTPTEGNSDAVFNMTGADEAEKQPDIYKADVTFGMSVTPSQNGDLVVNVIVGGKTIATKRLAGENKEGQNYGKITPDDNGNYTIEGLELPNGSTITLNLAGTQDLAKGVYLYTCNTGHEGSQTFVGLGEGERKVDLSVDLNFSVKEPEATITKTESGNTQQKTDTVTANREDKITQQQVSASITVTTTTTKEDHSEWENEWNNDYRPEPTTEPSTTPTTTTEPTTEPSSSEETTESTEPSTDPSESTEESSEETTEPTESTEPSTDPTEPTEPTEPTTPTEPTDPTEPTTPTEPVTEPTVPTTPDTPNRPDRPSTPDTPDYPDFDIPDDDVPLAPGPEFPDTPDFEIPDDDVPLTNMPDIPSTPDAPEMPEIEIPDSDVPLAELPEEPDEPDEPDEEIEIPDDEVPLAEMPDEEFEIPDDPVPLADVPATGDNAMWTVLMLLSAAGLVWMILEEKKHKADAE